MIAVMFISSGIADILALELSFTFLQYNICPLTRVGNENPLARNYQQYPQNKNFAL